MPVVRAVLFQSAFSIAGGPQSFKTRRYDSCKEISALGKVPTLLDTAITIDQERSRVNGAIAQDLQDVSGFKGFSLAHLENPVNRVHLEAGQQARLGPSRAAGR